MEYRKIEVASYNLHLIKTDKFKTISIKFVFRDEVKKDEITIRNLLLENLMSSCKKYPSKRLLSIKQQDLYDLNMFSSNRRIGNHTCSELCFQILNPNYVASDILSNTILFIKDIIFNPNIENNEFNKEIYDTCCNLVKEDILEEINYPKYYSLIKMKEYMDSTKPFSYHYDGYLEDIDKITPKSLYEYYKTFINNSLIDIYIVGDIDFYDTEKLIRDNIAFKTIKKDKKDIISLYSSSRKTIKEVEDNSSFNQSRLVIGCSFNNLTKDEIKYTLVLYNMILGNSPDSKLFNNVRESKSLTYDISSSYNKNDNILTITTGIDSSKKNITIDAIKEEMNNITKGEFNDNDLKSSKNYIISSLNEFEDYPNSIIEYFFSINYLDADDIEKSIKKINNITKEDIIKVSKKVKIDTIYFLKGDNNENS